MNEIKIMRHAQILPSGAIRCIYDVIAAIGTTQCMTTYAAGTDKHAEAYEQARASKVLATATEFQPAHVDLDDVAAVEAAIAAVVWQRVPQTF